jgi:DNA adenine methylase
MTALQTSKAPYQRSPIKWPGSKYKILDTILPLLGGYKKVIEPFAGGAAVLLNHPFEDGVLNDNNKHLINFYLVVQRNPIALVKELKKLFKPEHNSADSYYFLREKFNKSRRSVSKAALFVYLSKHSFNGVMRWNGNDKFNTPLGKYNSVNLPEQTIYELHEKLKKVKIIHGDFDACFSAENMTTGSCYFIDPPYIQLSKTANFTSYTSSGFSIADHERLSELIINAQRFGAKVIACNHDLPITRELHSKATNIISLDVPRYLSCKGQARKPVKELLAIYEP